MNIQAEKLEIMKMILETENQGILESIKDIFKKEAQSDFWETLTENQKQEIKEGIEEADSGKVIEFEHFIQKYHK
jgi:predicted transcriptional regulator